MLRSLNNAAGVMNAYIFVVNVDAGDLLKSAISLALVLWIATWKT